MELDDQLGRGGLPPVEVDTDGALGAVTGRGRRRLRRRRAVLGATAAIVLVAAGATAVAVRSGDTDGPNRVSTAPTAPIGPSDPTAVVDSTSTPDPTPTSVVVPTEPEAGDDAVWRIDPLHPPSSEDTSFVALVSRQACNSGETGEVLRPGVRFEAQRVIVEATVAPDLDGGNCPTNDEVPITVQLGRPLGDRVLVDAQCLPGGRSETSAYCGPDLGWPRVRWDPNPPSTSTMEVPGGPSISDRDREDAAAVVDAFLADLRAGRFEEAAARWSGYPAPSGADRTEQVRILGQADLLPLDDRDPRIEVAPSPGWTEAAPVVVVRVGGGTRWRAYAFVMGRDELGAMKVQRLPVPGGAVSAGGLREGAEIVGGRMIVLPASPVEGGVRVYVDGEEVGGRFDLDSRTVRIVVPEGEPGPITVTVATATPEVPAASSWAFLRR